MKSKLIILILNTLYLIATIIWAIVDKTIEPIVAIIGGLVSFATFFVANDNSFSVTYNKKNEQNVTNNDTNIGRQINVQGEYKENNYK